MFKKKKGAKAKAGLAKKRERSDEEDINEKDAGETKVIHAQKKQRMQAEANIAINQERLRRENAEKDDVFKGAAADATNIDRDGAMGKEAATRMTTSVDDIENDARAVYERNKKIEAQVDKGELPGVEWYIIEYFLGVLGLRFLRGFSSLEWRRRPKVLGQSPWVSFPRWPIFNSWLRGMGNQLYPRKCSLSFEKSLAGGHPIRGKMDTQKLLSVPL